MQKTTTKWAAFTKPKEEMPSGKGKVKHLHVWYRQRQDIYSQQQGHGVAFPPGDQQAHRFTNLSRVGPYVTPHFPHKSSCLLAGKWLGAHWHLHTRGWVTFRSTPYATLTATSTSALLTHCFTKKKKCINLFFGYFLMNNILMCRCCVLVETVSMVGAYGTWICTLTVKTCHKCSQQS